MSAGVKEEDPIGKRRRKSAAEGEGEGGLEGKKWGITGRLRWLTMVSCLD